MFHANDHPTSTIFPKKDVLVSFIYQMRLFYVFCHNWVKLVWGRVGLFLFFSFWKHSYWKMEICLTAEYEITQIKSYASIIVLILRSIIWLWEMQFRNPSRNLHIMVWKHSLIFFIFIFYFIFLLQFSLAYMHFGKKEKIHILLLQRITCLILPFEKSVSLNMCTNLWRVEAQTTFWSKYRRIFVISYDFFFSPDSTKDKWNLHCLTDYQLHILYCFISFFHSSFMLQLLALFSFYKGPHLKECCLDFLAAECVF